MIPDYLAAAVLDRPHDDTPRLAVADWLDDNSGRVECPACEGREGYWDDGGFKYQSAVWVACPACGGSGSVSDGRAEYAEFVRVQVELARMRSCCPICNPETGHRRDCVNGDRGDELRRRETALLSAHFGDWFDLSGWCWTTETGLGVNSQGGLTMIVARGFPAVARLSLAALVGDRCRCGMRPERAAAFGVPEFASGCPACSGTGRTPGLAAALGRVVGLTAVVPVDVEPWTNDHLDLDEGFRWWRASAWEGEGTDQAGNLPDEIYDMIQPEGRQMRSQKGGPPHRHFVGCHTRAAALDALSAACLAYCKSLAAHHPAAASS